MHAESRGAWDLPGFTPGRPTTLLPAVPSSRRSGSTKCCHPTRPAAPTPGATAIPGSNSSTQVRTQSPSMGGSSRTPCTAEEMGIPSGHRFRCAGFPHRLRGRRTGRGSAAEPHTSLRPTAGIRFCRPFPGAAGVADHADYSDLLPTSPSPPDPTANLFVREKSAAPPPALPTSQTGPGAGSRGTAAAPPRTGFPNIALHASDPDLGQQLTYRLGARPRRE